ncbi:MAG: serine hydrolase domain-containing protein [Flavitalea sp.]
MRKLFYGLFLLLSLTTFSQSKEKLTEAAPESVAVSGDRLRRIDRMLKEAIEENKMTGASALVARNGKIIYYKAFGYDDRENKKPLKRDAIYRIASQTKAITSVAVMILYEEGKLLLDDPISNYLNPFKNAQVLDKFNPKDTSYTTVPAKREVTIRDLLTHTSGIGYAQIGSEESNAIYFKNNVTAGIGSGRKLLAEDMQTLGGLPLMHQPGEKFTYGLNTDVLGYLVETLSGMALDSFFRTRIFEPLGMNDTYFYLPTSKYSRLVNVYIPDSTGKLNKAPEIINVNGPIRTDYPKLPGTYFSGGGGLSSTLLDYATFLQMMLNGGEYNGKRILSRNAVRMMTMNQIGDISLSNDKFGLGFEIRTEKGSAASPIRDGSFSWGGAFSTSYYVDPKEKLVFLFYKQLWGGDPSGNTTEKFPVLVYQALTD